MRIEDVDKNLRIESTINEPDIVWCDAFDKPFRRVGNRIYFTTNSTFLGFKFECGPSELIATTPRGATAGFELYRDIPGRHEYKWYMRLAPNPFFAETFTNSMPDDDQLCDYMLVFPLLAEVKHVYIAIKKGATVAEVEVLPNEGNPIIFYGTDTTKGLCAAQSGGAFPDIIATSLKVEIAKVYDFDSLANLVTENTRTVVWEAPGYENAKAFLSNNIDQYMMLRSINPDMQIIMVSPPTFGVDAVPYCSIIRSRLIVKPADDNMLFFVGPHDLEISDFPDAFTTDGVHPSPAGHELIARKLESIIH